MHNSWDVFYLKSARACSSVVIGNHKFRCILGDSIFLLIPFGWLVNISENIECFHADSMLICHSLCMLLSGEFDANDQKLVSLGILFQPSLPLGSFWAWAQPMRGGITMSWLLSLAEPTPKMIPVSESLCRYSKVSFLKIPTNRHPITCLWGWAIAHVFQV